MKSFRSLSDLADHLEESFKPTCIGSNEDLIVAHRRAAKVELAQTIIRSIRGEENRSSDGSVEV